jgi:hypothetical protein
MKRQRIMSKHAASREVRISSGLNVLLGTWAAVSPWALGYHPAGTVGVWSNTATGVLVAIFAGIRAMRPAQRVALSWINVSLGGVIGLSAWMFDYASNDLRMWSSVVTGVLIAVLASWSASTTAVYAGYRHAFDDQRGRYGSGIQQ